MRLLLAALLLLPALAGAASKPCAGGVQATSADFEARGPYPVTKTTFTFVDTSRVTPPNKTYPGAPQRTLVTDVYYPGSVGGALLDGAPYPLVIHSHGYLDARNGEAYVLDHLASHGYVVVSADYPLSNGGAPGGATIDDIANQPGDARFIIDQVLAMSATTGGPLSGKIDPERIGASGLSLGGLTTLLLTYHRDLRDPRIRAALPMAAPSCFFTKRFFKTSTAPLLVMHGTTDALVPLRENGQRTFRNARGHRHFVTLANGSHTGFTGFADLFPQEEHFDRIGCAGLLAGLGSALDDGTAFQSIANPRAGVEVDQKRCPLPCTEEPVDPSMSAARHHELTRLVATAFFDAYLKNDAGARCFIARGLDTEQGDTDVRSR